MVCKALQDVHHPGPRSQGGQSPSRMTPRQFQHHPHQSWACLGISAAPPASYLEEEAAAAADSGRCWSRRTQLRCEHHQRADPSRPPRLLAQGARGRGGRARGLRGAGNGLRKPQRGATMEGAASPLSRVCPEAHVTATQVADWSAREGEAEVARDPWRLGWGRSGYLATEKVCWRRSSSVLERGFVQRVCTEAERGGKRWTTSILTT